MTALEIKARKPRLGIVYPPPRNQFPQTNQKQNSNPRPQEGKKKKDCETCSELCASDSMTTVTVKI